jgi:GT2 family glycosyltransferase
MSISGQNLSIVIVTLRSEKVIDHCINSINKNLPIIVVENSDNLKFKNYLENNYKNVQCILSKENLGTGAGYNIGIKFSKTDYVYVINPDITLEANALDEIFLASKKLDDFSILSPISSDVHFPNYVMIKEKKNYKEKNLPFKVKYVDGFSMLLNKKKFKNNYYFDENFFMYWENNDICIRVINDGGSVFIVPRAKIKHLGAKAVDPKFFKEIELSRNWHWMWSTFNYHRKYKGFFISLLIVLPKLISAIIKILIYTLVINKEKKKIYYQRLSGLINAIMGKNSWYRPKVY